MNKEILRFVRPIAFIPAAGIVAAGIVLARSENKSGLNISQDQQTQPKTGQESYQQNGLPSEQILKEQVIVPKNLSDVFDLIESTGDEQIVNIGKRLRYLQKHGYIYVTENQKPENDKFAAESGRFPGTLVEWDSNSGLKIVVPEALLADPQVGEADLAFFLAANLKFAQNLEGRTIPSKEEVDELLNYAWLETLKKLFPHLGPMTRHPTLSLAYVQFVQCSQSEKCAIDVPKLR